MKRLGQRDGLASAMPQLTVALVLALVGITAVAPATPQERRAPQQQPLDVQS